MSIVRSIGRTIGVVVGFAPPLLGQTAPTVIPEEMSCPTCRIATTLVTTLSAKNDGFFPFITVAHDSRGRYYVGPLADRARIGVFTSAGVLLRTIGRPGSDPGEFMYSGIFTIATGDSIEVLDSFARRRTVLDSSYRLVRSSPFRAEFHRAVSLPDGRTVAQGRLSTTWEDQRQAHPLHVIDRTGNVVRSFGATWPGMPPDTIIVRAIAPSAPGALWSSMLDRYHLEQWTTDGARVRTLTRSPAWFVVAPKDHRIPEDERRPAGRIRGIRERADGNLWVITTMAKSNWRPDARWYNRDITADRNILDPTQLDRYVDTVIDLIDPRESRVITTLKVSRAIHGFAGDDVVYCRSKDAQGIERIEIWRLTVAGPDRRASR